MDITSTFTKQPEQDGEPTKINSDTVKDALANLLKPLNLNEAALNDVIISAISPFTNAPPVGPSCPVEQGNLFGNHEGPQGFSGDYTLVQGPDGEQYYTDNKGLFVNVKDMNIGDNAPTSISASPEEIVEVSYVKCDDPKSAGVDVTWNDDNTKILATINYPEGFHVNGVNRKYIFEYFTLLGAERIRLQEACDVSYSVEKIPTCSFYTAQQNDTDPQPSSYYKFDRPSKLRGSCSSELVIKNSGNQNPGCMFDGKMHLGASHCDFYAQEEWKTEFSTTGVDGKEVLIQHRRYGLGHLRWRAIPVESQEIIAFSNIDEKDPEGSFWSLIELAKDSIGELVEVSNTEPEALPQDKVYTHYVANV